MAALTGIGLLAALEGAADELHQAMAVLRTAGLDPTTTTIGVGDRALLAMPGAMGSGPIEATAPCPRCQAINSLLLNAATVPPYEPRTRWLAPGAGVREPTYSDLEGLPDDGTAVTTLAHRCTIGPVSLPDAIAALDEVDASLAGPIEFTCVDCGATIALEADIEQIVLDRLRAVADEVDREIHLLASRYTWDLATIESLPDARRRRLARFVEAS